MYKSSSTKVRGLAVATVFAMSLAFVPAAFAAAAHLNISRQPDGAVTGIALVVQPVVQIVDSSGNTVTSSTANVVASIASGNGTLSGTTTKAAVSGVATFTDLVITGSPGQFKLTFTVAGLPPVTSSAFSLKAGSAVSATIFKQPAGAIDGLPFAIQPVVRIVDSNGNKVSHPPVNVVASIASGSGRLTGTTTQLTTGGTATFTDLAITGTVGSFMLRFTPVGIVEVTSNAFPLAIGAPSKLAFARRAAGAVSRSAFGTQPAVRIADVGGNTVASNASAVTVVVSAGPVLIGSVNATAVGGVATFSGLGLKGISGIYSLTFNDGTFTPVSQSIALVQPGVRILIHVSRSAGITTIKISNAQRYAGKRATVIVAIKNGASYTYRTLGSALIYRSGVGVLKTKVLIASTSKVIAKIGTRVIARS